MHRRRAQLTITAVALLLGFLVVLQIRSQSAGSELDNRSTQDLTVLVANLNTKNDQLRAEVAQLTQELSDLRTAQARGEGSVGAVAQDLARVRAWSGLDPVIGPGIRVSVQGPISGPAVEELLNELRNAGADAVAVAGTRVVTGTVVSGAAGALTVEGKALGDPFEIDAVGAPETLTGTLTRAGGIIAQLSATTPDAQVSVTPDDSTQVPATTRPLTPAVGKPRL
jgi:uncharacterized protein YlxW (UPF0749 family)